MGKFHNSRRINIAFTSYVHAIPYHQYINVNVYTLAYKYRMRVLIDSLWGEKQLMTRGWAKYNESYLFCT